MSSDIVFADVHTCGHPGVKG